MNTDVRSAAIDLAIPTKDRPVLDKVGVVRDPRYLRAMQQAMTGCDAVMVTA
jgi:hypothetical protein